MYTVENGPGWNVYFESDPIKQRENKKLFAEKSKCIRLHATFIISFPNTK